jgi:hypothetical protein
MAFILPSASSAWGVVNGPFVSPLIDTQRIRDPRRGKSSKAPTKTKRAQNFGRTRVITPQAFVAFTVNPQSDQENRLKGADDQCIAPYESDPSAYACLEGEIAFIYTNEASNSQFANLPVTVMSGMHVFTNMAGIPLSQLEYIRPVGMLKNGGPEFGVTNSIRNGDGFDGVVIGQGLCTITNTGPLQIVNGQHVWINPFPWVISDANQPSLKIQGLDTPFVTGKWYPATYSTVADNVIGLTRGLRLQFDDSAGAGKPLHPTRVETAPLEYLVNAVTNVLQLDFHLQASMPMWFYGFLEAGLKMLDGCLTDKIPEGLLRFLFESYNRCTRSAARIQIGYEKLIGVEGSESEMQKQLSEVRLDYAVYKDLGYTEFNKLFRRLFESMLSSLQNKAEESLRRNIIGIALTSAAPGRTFDILLGYKS